MRNLRQPVTRIALLCVALLCAIGCSNKPATPTAATPAPKPALMDAPTRALFAKSAAQHPPFQVLLQKQDLPTVLVVAEDTTEDQLKSLLWHLRIETREGKLKDLGIHPTAVVFGTPSYGSGELAIYRGPRCAHEMYGAANPCGPSIHKAASYHWGDGGDPRSDSASIIQPTGTSDFVFSADDGFQTDDEARTDPKGALRKASHARIQYAIAQNAKSTKQHSDIRYAIGEPDNQLRIVSYQLGTDAGRDTFLKQFLILEQDHLCPLGFKTLQLGALSSPARSYPIACKK